MDVDWAFSQPKNIGGGGGGMAPYPLPNLAISNQMMMKLGKNILWVEVFTQIDKIFDDVVLMLILWRHQNATAEKIEGFQKFWLNISKTV